MDRDQAKFAEEADVQTQIRKDVAAKRADRINELIVVATRLFNRKGFLSTRMEEIAEALNTTPGNIYHYVKSKEELAYQCYLRACEVRRTQLHLANDSDISGLDRIKRFLGSVLVESQSRVAILGELGALRAEWDNRIRRLQRANIQAAQQLIATGIHDGSIAPVNPFLSGIGLLGVVEWISYWYTNRLPYTRKEITDELTDIMVYGVTRTRPFDVDIPRLDTPYPPMEQSDPFDKKALADLKLQRFLRVAMESFNKNGVQATSIDQIARQLNVTKGAFYYYFKNKEELLYMCYERATAFNRVALTHVNTQDYNEREILTRRSLFERHVSDLGPFPAYHNLTSLAGRHQSHIMEDLTNIQSEDRDRIASAIKAGDFREVDPFIAEKVRAGLINWFPVWYSAEGRYTPTEVADNHSWLFLNGLASTES